MNAIKKLGLVALLGLSTLPQLETKASYKPNIPKQKIEFNYDEIKEPDPLRSTFFTYDEWLNAIKGDEVLDKIILSVKASGIDALKDLSYELLSNEEQKEYKELWETFDLDDSKYSTDDFYDRLNLQEIYAQQKRLRELYNFDFNFHKPSVGEKVIIFKDMIYQRRLEKEKQKSK